MSFRRWRRCRFDGWPDWRPRSTPPRDSCPEACETTRSRFGLIGRRRADGRDAAAMCSTPDASCSCHGAPRVLILTRRRTVSIWRLTSHRAPRIARRHARNRGPWAEQHTRFVNCEATCRTDRDKTRPSPELVRASRQTLNSLSAHRARHKDGLDSERSAAECFPPGQHDRSGGRGIALDRFATASATSSRTPRTFLVSSPTAHHTVLAC